MTSPMQKPCGHAANIVCPPVCAAYSSIKWCGHSWWTHCACSVTSPNLWYAVGQVTDDYVGRHRIERESDPKE